MSTILDFTPQERKEFNKKLDELDKELNQFLREIRETIEERGKK